jgi:hypothetical protein
MARVHTPSSELLQAMLLAQGWWLAMTAAAQGSCCSPSNQPAHLHCTLCPRLTLLCTGCACMKKPSPATAAPGVSISLQLQALQQQLLPRCQTKWQQSTRKGCNRLPAAHVADMACSSNSLTPTHRQQVRFGASRAVQHVNKGNGAHRHKTLLATSAQWVHGST